MKKRSSIYLTLAMILMTSMACSVGGTAVSTEVEKEPTPGSEQTNPVATTVPSQEAVGNDPSAGPETIDLTNPALYIVPSAPAFKFESTIKYTGVDTTGVAKEVSEIGLVEVQTQPQTTQHFLSSLDGYVDSPGTKGSINILSSDTVIIGDQMTSAQMVSAEGGTPKLFCNTTLVSEIQGPGMLESMFKLQDMITGQATRVESGIDVNGYVTDKYSLTSDNLGGGDGSASAFVYVARDGGFITRFELQFQTNENRYGFDPNQFTDTRFEYNYNLVEDGSLDIVIPAECAK
jgi:hypothetical protein